MPLALIEVNWSAEQLSHWANAVDAHVVQLSRSNSGRVQLDAGCVLQFQCAASNRRLHTWPRIRQPTQDGRERERESSSRSLKTLSWCVQILWFSYVYSHLKSLWVSLFVCECVFLSQYKVSLNLTIFNEQLLVRLLCILFKLQHFVWLCLFAQLAHWCFLIKEIVSQVAQNCLIANNQLLQIAKCFGFMSKSSIEYMYMYLYSHSVAFTRCHCKHCNTPELIKCANLYKNLLELYAREMPKITLSKAIICTVYALYILYYLGYIQYDVSFCNQFCFYRKSPAKVGFILRTFLFSNV